MCLCVLQHSQCVPSDASVVHAALHRPGIRIFGLHKNNNYSNIAASSNAGAKHDSGSKFNRTALNVKMTERIQT